MYTRLCRALPLRARHVFTGFFVFILSLILFPSTARSQSGTVALSGELKKWHPIAFTLEGPSSSETAEPNPFLDYRFTVTFTRGTKSVVVPGYFAADGNAANTSATSGNKWRAHFMPDETGTWTYTISFRTGEGIAIDDSPTAGQPASVDGITGSFAVSDTDKTGKDFRARGVLRYVGEHYLQFDSGEWFVSSGTGSPENFLGYKEFDNTSSTANFSPKSYTAHINDWNAGDPSWGTASGKGIIGAINYLSGAGVNGMFMLIMNSDGDASDTFPWIQHKDFYHFDVSKLAQWHIVFEHMNKKGIMPQLVLQEMDIEHLLDNGELGETRKLFYREMMARFNHLNGVTWNIGEEHRIPELGGNTNAQRQAFVHYLASLNAYNHPIVMHTSAGVDNYNKLFGPFLGNPDFSGMSYHIHGMIEDGKNEGGGLNTYVHARTWRQNSAFTGNKWIITLDECCGWNTGVKPDQSNLVAVRRDEMWGVLMAGGSGYNWYLGFDTEQRDLRLEDFRTYDFLWETGGIAADFFREYLPFSEMQPVSGLTPSGNIRVFAIPGEVYAILLREGGTTTLDLQSSSESFDVLWYNPRTGGDLLTGTVGQVTGPGVRSLGNPPFDTAMDWVALVRSGNPLDRLVARFTSVATTEPFEIHFDASSSTSSMASIASYTWDFGDGSTGTGDQINHMYASTGFYPVELTVRDSEGKTTTDTQTIEVKAPTASGPFFENNGLLVIEAENYETNVALEGQAWMLDREVAGSQGSGAMVVRPDVGGFYSDQYSIYSPGMSFLADFSTTGTYYVWLRLYAPNLNGNSLHIGFDGKELSTTMETNTQNTWVWLGTRLSDNGRAVIDINTPGKHSINVWAREDGLLVDRMILTTNAGYIPSGAGPGESAREGENMPFAIASATHETGFAPLLVAFDASASVEPPGTTITYAWNFGDGSFGTGKTTNHTYNTEGAYTVTLTMTSSNGYEDTATLSVDVLPYSLEASFSFDPASGTAPATVSFDASNSLPHQGAAITSYAWNFGDGGTATGETTDHTFELAGDYLVTLAIEDENGYADSDSATVHIEPRPASHELHIASILTETLQETESLFVGLAHVAVLDEYNFGVPGVQVSGEFTGEILGAVNGLSNALGVVDFTSSPIDMTPSSVMFCVRSVELTGLEYHPEHNADPAFQCSSTSGVNNEEESLLPAHYNVFNYPNPFHQETTIVVDLPEPALVSLRLYNMLGQEVARVLEGQTTAGSHAIKFTASGLSDGLYIYTLEANHYRASKTMMVLH